MTQDEEHLRLLSIFHYVVGGILALFACFPVVHLIMGILIVTETIGGTPQGPPPFMGWFFVLVGGMMILVGWTLAVCVIIAGRFLATRRRHLFCMVIAAIECLFMPLGTILGVFTIIVLSRESVKALFQAPRGLQPGIPAAPPFQR